MPHRESADQRFAAPPDFACAQHDAGEETVRVIISGELDLATSPVLDQALRDAQPRVVLDLRGLTFIDCSSLSVLVKAADQARAAGGRFRVVEGTQIVERLFSLTGIERRLEMTS
jgi:anti-sigma B factor antagonist